LNQPWLTELVDCLFCRLFGTQYKAEITNLKLIQISFQREGNSSKYKNLLVESTLKNKSACERHEANEKENDATQQTYKLLGEIRNITLVPWQVTIISELVIIMFMIK
jgi:hypothetical protein